MSRPNYSDLIPTSTMTTLSGASSGRDIVTADNDETSTLHESKINIPRVDAERVIAFVKSCGFNMQRGDAELKSMLLRRIWAFEKSKPFPLPLDKDVTIPFLVHWVEITDVSQPAAPGELPAYKFTLHSTEVSVTYAIAATKKDAGTKKDHDIQEMLFKSNVKATLDTLKAAPWFDPKKWDDPDYRARSVRRLGLKMKMSKRSISTVDCMIGTRRGKLNDRNSHFLSVKIDRGSFEEAPLVRYYGSLSAQGDPTKRIYLRRFLAHPYTVLIKFLSNDIECREGKDGVIDPVTGTYSYPVPRDLFLRKPANPTELTGLLRPGLLGNEKRYDQLMDAASVLHISFSYTTMFTPENIESLPADHPTKIMTRYRNESEMEFETRRIRDFSGRIVSLCGIHARMRTYSGGSVQGVANLTFLDTKTKRSQRIQSKLENTEFQSALNRDRAASQAGSNEDNRTLDLHIASSNPNGGGNYSYSLVAKLHSISALRRDFNHREANRLVNRTRRSGYVKGLPTALELEVELQRSITWTIVVHTPHLRYNGGLLSLNNLLDSIDREGGLTQFADGFKTAAFEEMQFDYWINRTGWRNIMRMSDESFAKGIAKVLEERVLKAYKDTKRSDRNDKMRRGQSLEDRSMHWHLSKIVKNNQVDPKWLKYAKTLAERIYSGEYEAVIKEWAERRLPNADESGVIRGRKKFPQYQAAVEGAIILLTLWRMEENRGSNRNDILMDLERIAADHLDKSIPPVMRANPKSKDPEEHVYGLLQLDLASLTLEMFGVDIRYSHALHDDIARHQYHTMWDGSHVWFNLVMMDPEDKAKFLEARQSRGEKFHLQPASIQFNSVLFNTVKPTVRLTSPTRA